MIPTILMILVVLGLKIILPINYFSRWSCIGYVAIVSVVGAIVYLVVSYKMNIVNNVFGKPYVSRIIKKLTFGKISI